MLSQFKKYGLISKRIKFPCLMKDWSKMKASMSSNYPQSPVYIWKYELQDSDYDYIERLIKAKLIEINTAIENDILPECSDEERWYTGTKYAVYKKAGDDEERNKEMHIHKTLRNPIQISGQFYPLEKDLTDKDILETMHNITVLILEVRKIVNSKK